MRRCGDRRQAERRRQRVLHQQARLRRRPQRQLVRQREIDHRDVKLRKQVVRHGAGEFLLENQIGFLECLFRFAVGIDVVRPDVARLVRMDQR